MKACSPCYIKSILYQHHKWQYIFRTFNVVYLYLVGFSNGLGIFDAIGRFGYWLLATVSFDRPLFSIGSYDIDLLLYLLKFKNCKEKYRYLYKDLKMKIYIGVIFFIFSKNILLYLLPLSMGGKEGIFVFCSEPAESVPPLLLLGISRKGKGKMIKVGLQQFGNVIEQGESSSF